MPYIRRVVKDNETVMNADLYNNVQDGIDEAKQGVKDVREAVDESKIGYDKGKKYLVIGGIVDVIDDGDDGDFDEHDMITPEDAADIFNEIEGNS